MEATANSLAHAQQSTERTKKNNQTMILTSRIGYAAAGLFLIAGGFSIAADKDAVNLPNGAVRQFGQDAPREPFDTR